MGELIPSLLAAPRRYSVSWVPVILVSFLLNTAQHSNGDRMDKPVHNVDSLHHFQQLKVSHLAHSLTGRHTDVEHRRQIKLRLFDKDLHLHLAVHDGLFHPKFKAHEVNGRNQKVERTVNQAAFYNGFVKGEANSHVVAHVSPDNVLTASIHTPSDTYSIEPSKKHIKEDHDFHMIAYRDTDIIKSKRVAKVCGLSPEDEDKKEETITHSHNLISPASHWWQFGYHSASDNETRGDDSEMSHHRLRRQVTTPNIACPVTLVADSFYFSLIGRGDFQTTASSMIQQLNFADATIFTMTKFLRRDSSEIAGAYGMQLRSVIVHTEATTDGTAPYNTGNPTAVRDLLTAMSRGNWNTTASNNMPGVCLAHLFTHQGFAGNVLGLAYVASPDRNSVGGVCNRVFQGNRWLNVGLTTTQNCPSGDTCQTLIQREADLVTAHELGHNWGSKHDTTAACVSNANGRFLMNTYALPGTEANNELFSTCSRESIGAVILGKQDVCFISRASKFCGNGKVEDNEQCDSGIGNAIDPCCINCRFRNQSFTCSDSNDVCCVNCTYAPATKVCQEDSEARDISCRAQSNCSGVDTSCNVQFKSSGVCGNSGQCRSTSSGATCLGYCEATLGQVSCVCPDVAEQCVVCCKERAGSNCTAVKPALNIQDGAGCGIGYCVAGTCRQAVLDTTERLFGFLSDFSIDTIARWFRDNIVAAVLVCTVIAWIIGGCVVRYSDRREMRKFVDEFEEYKAKYKEYIVNRSVDPRTLNKHRNAARLSLQAGGAADSRTRGAAVEMQPLMGDALVHQ